MADSTVIELKPKSASVPFDIRVLLAFFAIYVLWGTTFLAIRIAVQEVPPGRGKPVTVEFLVLGMVVQSGNDATIALAERIACFERRFNAKAQPFRWNFTRVDLELFLDKLHAHEDAPGERVA